MRILHCVSTTFCGCGNEQTKRLNGSRSLLSALQLIAASGVLAASLGVSAQTPGGGSDEFKADIWTSTEFKPMDSGWFTNPWPETDIPNRLTPSNLNITQPGGTSGEVIRIDPNERFQRVIGLGSSLEHTTVYAIRKNKTRQQQRDLLRSLIDPDDGIGMNLFRVSIGTSDFADGTRATPAPDNDKGWYSLQDTETAAFSIERDRSLGIIDTVKMAVDIGEQSNNPLKIVGSPWSPPRWMRERNNMVQGGPILEEYYDDYAQYMRNFVEAYEAEGIPIYALTVQNERQFEPGSYPGMVISWQMERDMLIKVYENFHNIGANFGRELDVKLWTLDHNFDYWSQAKDQLDDLKARGIDDYLDATAFHHYGGSPDNMSDLHAAHPDKDVIFTEGTLWGLSADGNRRSYEALIRHFRNWSTGYMSWVTMTTQTLDEANQGPYNGLGALDPTLLVKNDGNNSDWYRTPEYWLMSQFSKFIQPGAQRIESNYGSLQTVTNVAFLNPDGTIVAVVANSTGASQNFDILSEGNQITATIPARSISTYRWQSGLGASPHPWVEPPQPSQDPYNGDAASLPGTVEAEDYDLGGLNVAYFDNDFGNIGGGYRNEGVDIEANDSGFHVGWVNIGEWLEYTVVVAEAGSYDFVVSTASDASGGSLYFEIDGEIVSETLNTQATGGWKTFVDSRINNVLLPAGNFVLRLVIDGGEFNIDKFRVEASGSNPSTPTPTVTPTPTPNPAGNSPYLGSPINLPGVLEMEYYDLGGPGVAYNDQDTQNRGGDLRNDEVDVQANGSGHHVGWINSGEWLEYTVNIDGNDTYQMAIDAASQTDEGKLQLSINGQNYSDIITLPITGGWTNFQTTRVNNIALPQGESIIRITFAAREFNVDKITFSNATDGGYLPLPGLLQAENYKDMSGIQTETTTDTGGGENIGYLDAGDWLSYKVNPSSSGTYRIEYRVASQGGSAGFELLAKGETVDMQTVPDTGAWQNWTSVSADVELDAGPQELRINAIDGSWNMNWIRFSRN